MAPSNPSLNDSPMWLSHHLPGEYDRCVTMGKHHVCRRCLVLYPLAIVVAVCQVAGLISAGLGLWMMWIAPIGVFVEWCGEHLFGWSYVPQRQIVLSGGAAIGLGVAFGIHATSPFELSATLPVLTYAVACFAVWLIGARRKVVEATDTWETEFERDEAERLERLSSLIR